MGPWHFLCWARLERRWAQLSRTGACEHVGWGWGVPSASGPFLLVISEGSCGSWPLSSNSGSVGTFLLRSVVSGKESGLLPGKQSWGADSGLRTSWGFVPEGGWEPQKWHRSRGWGGGSCVHSRKRIQLSAGLTGRDLMFRASAWDSLSCGFRAGVGWGDVVLQEEGEQGGQWVLQGEQRKPWRSF